MTGRHAAPKIRSPRRAGLRRTVLTTTALTGLSAALVTAAAPGQAVGQSRGFVAAYEKAGRGDADEKAFLKKHRLLDTVSAKLNRQLKIPATITVAGKSCGNSDVAYDPETAKVEVCYEFVAEVRDMFKDARSKNVSDKTAGVVTETLYHEAAHALIHKLDLPFTGREEDAADQFAAYNLIPQGAKGQRALLAAAENYDLYAKDQPLEEIDFSDEHTPHAARSATYRSYLHGAAPKRWKKLVDGKHLTRARADFSEDEYRDLRQGWSHLLKPHRKIQ
ncbi:DUF4344 domain-containing metallopeptidase [Streptomyces spiramyceticus]|uniref:DUF4344 domain-containing metallopeptidase n=1 Tax=Streptomyces spiramyceticus TaxID=299717 RepID=UPI00237A8396|nr:DUF4344 domain-containing metallopeptidase [Streptomyces spiramyceticus]